MSLKKSRVNWHEAACCAFQIELKDYADILEYIMEYVLGKNYHRIDLLIIKKLANVPIPKNIALIFQTFNLLEIKGNLHYPRNLMRHLIQERKLTVAKISPGVYHINKEIFSAQIIVTKELPPEDNLYLHFLTARIWDGALAERLADDYKEHQEEDIYRRYLHQIALAGSKAKGGASMYICEGLLNLCGTSSEEIIERTKKEEAEYYLPRINQLSLQNNQLSLQNDQLSSQNANLFSQINYLKSLLTQNGIPFNL